MNLLKLGFLILSTITAPPSFADKLPFETFAFKELELGLETDSTHQILNGLGRCLGVFILATENPLHGSDHVYAPDSDFIKAMDALYAFSLMQHLRYNGYSTKERSPEIIAVMEEEANQGANYFADAYHSWIVRSGENYQRLPKRHPFMLEYEMCIKEGVSVWNAMNPQ